MCVLDILVTGSWLVELPGQVNVRIPGAECYRLHRVHRPPTRATAHRSAFRRDCGLEAVGDQPGEEPLWVVGHVLRSAGSATCHMAGGEIRKRKKYKKKNKEKRQSDGAASVISNHEIRSHP